MLGSIGTICNKLTIFKIKDDFDMDIKLSLVIMHSVKYCIFSFDIQIDLLRLKILILNTLKQLIKIQKIKIEVP